MPWFPEPLLLKRVNKYLTEHSNIRNINVFRMADELQNEYQDYANRSRPSFRMSVKYAYKSIRSLDTLQNELKSHTLEPSTPNSLLVDLTDEDNESAINNSRNDETTALELEPQTPHLSKKRKRPLDDVKKKEPAINLQYFEVSLNDFWSNDSIKKIVDRYIYNYKTRYTIVNRLFTTSFGGLLIGGLAGCGKSTLAKAMANELSLPIITINVKKIPKEEIKLEKYFKTILNEITSLSVGVLLLIENVEFVCPINVPHQSSPLHFMKTLLLDFLEEIDKLSEKVSLIGTVREIENLDADFIRADIFRTKVVLTVPNQVDREGILKLLLKDVELSEDVDIYELASITPGYTGRDLQLLHASASNFCVDRGMATNDKSARICLNIKDFQDAMKIIVPSVKSQGFAAVPDITWEDIGSLVNIRSVLDSCILAPLQHPDLYSSKKHFSPGGILLFGPPGCGKTLLAKAVANEGRLNFLYVKGPEIFDQYVGGSEKNVRLVFERAACASPCVIFFDEFDAICPNRSSHSGDGGRVDDKVVNTLLAEMDGFKIQNGVYVLAATNRPETIDPAVLRSGRFSKLIYVGMPTPDDRELILKTFKKKIPLSNDVDLGVIARDSRCEGCNGADLALLVSEAHSLAIDDVRSGILERPVIVYTQHFEKALSRIRRSVSEQDLRKYEVLKEKYSCNV